MITIFKKLLGEPLNRVFVAGAVTAVFAFVLLQAAPSYSASPSYTVEEARRSLMNPHEQINDEGEVLWNKCLICHKVIPDVYKDKSIEDVKLRFEDDLKQGCYRCHPERKHPGGEWVGRALGTGTGAPEHLVVPPRYIRRNIRLSMKEDYMKLPMDPKTGKITCSTCHNPHERGVLVGRADAGADRDLLLRSTGTSICQYCHRK